MFERTISARNTHKHLLGIDTRAEATFETELALLYIEEDHGFKESTREKTDIPAFAGQSFRAQGTNSVARARVLRSCDARTRHGRPFGGRLQLRQWLIFSREACVRKCLR